MLYTPKFQEILDKIDEMSLKRYTKGDMQEFFKNSVLNLGSDERLNNLYRIRPKEQIPGSKARLIQFKRNRMQQAFAKARTNRDLVLKMRQGGITTDSSLVSLDQVLWEMGFQAAVMAHVTPNVKTIFKIVKGAYNQFTKDWGELYPTTPKYDSVNELALIETEASVRVCTETKGITLD